jgi:hypothetical protein
MVADAIATKRFDAQTGADREVQRILLELLNQMDGFDQQTNVKVTVNGTWQCMESILYLSDAVWLLRAGYHGDEPRRYAGPRPAAAWSLGPQD